MGNVVKDSTDESGRGPGYLSGEQSGVSWMFDPSSPALACHVRGRAAGADAPARRDDYLRDAEELKDLLGERHVAVVLDPAKRALTDAAVDGWVRYLQAANPGTRTGCAGTLGRDLGLALRDGHLHVRDSTGAHVNKARQGMAPGPPWGSRTSSGVRIVRIRTLDGSAGKEPVLLAGAANHGEDFLHRRIIVDLRGNGGGDDAYVLSWFAPHAPKTAPACRERTMTLSNGTPLVLWNYLALLAATGQEAPDSLARHLVPPTPNDRISISDMQAVDDGAAPPFARPGEHDPWDGQMIIVIDGGTGSSAESAALQLKTTFGAVVVGGPSYGIIEYGNAVPYFLPASGLEIHLPSQANDWGTPVDFTGIQPDVPVSVHTSTQTIAAEFDVLYRQGMLHRNVAARPR